jgi:hypothetical protein
MKVCLTSACFSSILSHAADFFKAYNQPHLTDVAEKIKGF